MAVDPQCIFCKIAAGEIPASIIYQNDHAVAFLDIGPLAQGHLLLIPRDHAGLITEIEEKTCGAITSLLPRLGNALLRVTGAEGFNVLQNNGQAAGQVVGHVHFHLIPRSSGDGLGYRWNAGTYEPGRVEELRDAYKAALG